MQNKNLSVVFMGTPDFAVPSLKAVYNNFNLKAVVTVPDKPKGRGRKLLPSPVKKVALELGVQVLQPSNLKSDEFYEQLKAIAPDFIVVIAFRILPEKIFSLSRIATFNIHGSLLPKYRGAAPINWAIINGEKQTGLTSFVLDNKVDTGKILLNVTEKISPDDTAGDLHDRLMPKAAGLTTETIALLASGKYELKAQDDSDATSAPKLFRKDLKIDFSGSAESVRNLIHGTSPVPGSWTVFNNKNLKLLRAGLSDTILEQGEFKIDDNGFLIGCKDKSVSLKEIQLEGKSTVSVTTFLNGYRGEKSGFMQ
jgi:methionyl-tRNA formyltransferase